MNIIFAKYGTGSWLVLRREVLKRGAADFGTSSDYTPAAGDVKVKIDNGSVANIATLPSFVVSGNTAYLEYTFSDAELTGKRITVTLSDSATKAVEDDAFELHTFGHASALYPTDYSVASSAQTGDSYARIGANGAGLTALGDARLANLDAAISGVAAAVWGYGTRTLTAFGTLVSDIWSNASRTLSAFGFNVTLDSAERVKLHATQPDYAPLKATDYTAPDNTGIGNAASSAATAATEAAGANTKAGAIQTVLSGITSLANWLRAGFRSSAPDATAAAEIGGTYDATTDSQQALRDRGDAAWGAGSVPTVEEIDAQLSATHGSGAWGASDASGAYTVTVTVVDDDTDLPLSQAQVTVRDSGGAIHHQERTNASGEVSFPAGDDAYTVSVLGLPGYNGVADQAFTVAGADEAVEVRLAVIASGSATPGTRVVRVITIDASGNPVANVPVRARLTAQGRSSVDQALIVAQVPSVESDENGIADLVCITEDQFEGNEGDGVYVFKYGSYEATTTVPAGEGRLNLQEHLRG